ncbi:aminopeptidase N [Jatrophihabitans sp.]|uniref:aminopeptidase N n=1 Tax=Jatrophihabitans sp. TaxID=1932789 RepID=UPI002D0FF7A2|nr:aminopeptidase N [Jatrophihabitans sp.]
MSSVRPATTGPSAGGPESYRIDANTVRMPNLTREDARHRAGLLQVDSYDVALDLTDAEGGPSERTFRSRTTVTFSANQPGASTFLDVIAERFHEVSLNGQPVDVSGYEPADGIVLPELAEHNVVVVDADLLYTTNGQGLHRFVDPLDGEVYLYSQFETTDSKRMFACFDQPDLKATFTLHVTAPAHWQVVSNGVVTEVEDDDETKTVHFATTPRVSTYITALVAGPYFSATDSHDGVDLGLYCRASLAEHLDSEELFTITKQGFDWYHQNFGHRYPFGKYDQCFVPEFNAGAMENAGCVTATEDYIFTSRVTDVRRERRATTVLHELAHMWFGNLVTMRWFEDLWLNESFAEWAGNTAQAQATAWPGIWTTFATTEKAWAYRQDQYPSTHPVACEIPDAEAVEVNFDGITYAKGASVLKQLVAYVGLPQFLAGLRQYFADHAYRNTTLADLLDALNATSGRELSGWSKLWVETSGMNTLSADYQLDAEGRFSSFAVLQDAPRDTSPDNTLRPHRLAIGLYRYTEDGRLVRTDRVEVDVDGERTEIAELVGRTRPDLVLLNDDDLTYCKLRLDPHSMHTLQSGGLAALEDSLARTLCWSAAWEMVRDGVLATRHYLDLVSSAAGTESVISVVQTVAKNLLLALEMYADPEWATGARVRFGELALANARAAAPGSDHQLAWVHALLNAGEQLDVVAGLLSGAEQLDGLVVDTDLRWLMLRALVGAGRAGEAEIAAAAAEDPSASGARHAATARARIPTAEAKAAAWQLMIHDSELSTAMRRAVMTGFRDPWRPDLLTPYVDSYFAEAAGLWDRLTTETARYMIIGLVPTWSDAIDERTVRLAEEFLANTSHPAALRRLVDEGRADMVRALRARAADTENATADGD